MKLFLTLLISFLFLHIAYGQSNYDIEELKQQLQTATVDSEQVRYLYRLGDQHVDINLAQAMAYADSGLRKATQINWQKGIAALHLLRGNVYNKWGYGDSALIEYNKALAISRKRKDPNAIASALNDIAVIYYDKADYPQAMAYYIQALNIATQTKEDKLLGKANQNIGSIFFAQGDYEKALTYYEIAMQHYIKQGNNLSIANMNDAIAGVYAEKKDDKKARAYYEKALAFYQENDNPMGMAAVYSHISHLYQSSSDTALAYKLKAQSIWDTINPKSPFSITNLGNIGYSYFEHVRQDSTGKLTAAARKSYIQKAIDYTEKSINLSIEINDKDNESHYLLNLAEINEWLGNYKIALEYAKNSYNIHDSLFSQENKNKIAALESARELESREKQIKINQLALSNERRTRWALIAGAILLLIIAGLLYYQNLSRRKANTTLLTLNTELNEANKIKAKFFGILSHDLRSPIASLVNYLQLQEEAPLDAADVSQLRTEIQHTAADLLENMENLLIWSKSQMENFKPVYSEVSVKTLFDYLRKSFDREKSINFIYQDDNVQFINSDPYYLQTIMYNLTTNAVKALKQRKNAVVEWKAWKEDNTVYLSITDNGPGITKEATSPLFKTENSQNKKTGFGLHIIRDLAKAIQCTVTLDSNKNNGTRFILQL